MKWRGLRPLAVILCLCVLLLFATLPALADFGDFSGGYDYDYSYGGSDYDSGSFDFGDDDYSYGGDYGSGSVIPFPIPIFAGNGFLLFLLIIFLVYYFNRRRTAGGGSTVHRPAAYTPPSVTPLAKYKELDPGFDETVLRERISNLYVQMQNCWTAKDIEPLRPYFTDAYFQQMQRQLDNLKRAGRTNYVERIAVLSVELPGYRQEGGMDYLVANVHTRIVDYTLDDASGKLVSGSQDREKFMSYEWTLCRKSGTLTGEKTGQKQSVCPSCGAPLDVNASARCPYCGSVFSAAASDWAISSIRGIRQETR